jgi:hypothetical protein
MTNTSQQSADVETNYTAQKNQAPGGQQRVRVRVRVTLRVAVMVMDFPDPGGPHRMTGWCMEMAEFNTSSCRTVSTVVMT